MRVSLLGFSLLSSLVRCASAQWIIDPPTTADPATPSSCTNWHVAATGDTCPSIADAYFITLADFQSYNPSVTSACNLITGNSYCVELNWGLPPEGPTSTSSTSIPTTTGNGISTPTPTQSGMVKNCNKFYFVQTDDGCAVIASNNGISLSDFYAWNPAVKTDCTGLWANVYVCVGILGGTPPASTTTPATTTTAPGNGIATPTPTQPGMVSNCNRFYFVNSGEGCADVAAKNGITVQQFTEWNTGVGASCSGLWANVYACVGVVGVAPPTSTSKPPATTTKGNGVATPTPIQAGMVGNCDRFHLVVSGDSCWGIAQQGGISLDDFYRWNAGVGNNCQSLWLGYYVCTSLI